MKQIRKRTLGGDSKGYLIPKKELDEKLKERFETLKGKIISNIHAWHTNAARIYFCDTLSFEKKENGAFLYNPGKEE
ncbi:MAG: hypothetical protein U9R34_05240 [Nanoarchaeota archaeon]|nr:hypothetical protein [Nanoarchaeota archaeon]